MIHSHQFLHVQALQRLCCIVLSLSTLANLINGGMAENFATLIIGGYNKKGVGNMGNIENRKQRLTLFGVHCSELNL